MPRKRSVDQQISHAKDGYDRCRTELEQTMRKAEQLRAEMRDREKTIHGLEKTKAEKRRKQQLAELTKLIVKLNPTEQQLQNIITLFQRAGTVLLSLSVEDAVMALEMAAKPTETAVGNPYRTELQKHKEDAS